MVGTLLLVAIPPFLPMASTAMPDILATTLGIVAIERLAAWKADQRWHQGGVAAIALGLAGFARSHLVLLVPLGAFFLLESTNPHEMLGQIRRKLWLWTPVVAGALLLFVIIVTTRERSMALDPPPTVTGLQNIHINLRSYLLYFVFPLPLAACWIANRWSLSPRRLGVILLTTTVIGMIRGKVTFLVVLGFCVLADLLIEALRKRDHDGLFLSLWLLVPLPIVYYAHLPIKYRNPMHTCGHSRVLSFGSFLSGSDCPRRRYLTDPC
jgi:hypothetical protein